MKIRKNITIGADPEFAFIDPQKNGIVPAFDVVSGGTSAKLGTDGASSTAEIRPDAHIDPLIVVEDIKHLLQRLKNVPYLVRAGNFPFVPTGGHIHFGFDRNKIKNRDRAIAFLDALICMPLVNKYDTDLARKRLDYGYGHCGSYELKPYGFEYRTPASWILHPKIAKGVLFTAKMGMEYFIENQDSLFDMSTASVWHNVLKFSVNKYGSREVWDFYRWLQSPQKWDEYADVLTNWKIKRVIKPVISNDDFMERIRNSHHFFVEVSIPVFIYGVAKERGDCTIWTSKKIDLSEVEYLGKKIKIENGAFGRGQYNNCAIGISYDIRKRAYEDIMDTIKLVDILNEIIERLDNNAPGLN